MTEVSAALLDLEIEFNHHCEEHCDEAIQLFWKVSGLLRGACHRAALCADPLARNDGNIYFADRSTLTDDVVLVNAR